MGGRKSRAAPAELLLELLVLPAQLFEHLGRWSAYRLDPDLGSVCPAARASLRRAGATASSLAFFAIPGSHGGPSWREILRQSRRSQQQVARAGKGGVPPNVAEPRGSALGGDTPP